MALLNRAELLTAIDRLGQFADADGMTIELIVVGGGVMVLEFGARSSTRDLDAIVSSTVPDGATVRQYAAAVAGENKWPADWLNDGAKGFLIGPLTPTLMYRSAGIRVFRPSIEQLLAMKLCAWRDDVDVADAARLLSELPSEQHQVWASLEPFLQPGRELTARYAFDDLWEERK